MVTKDVNILEIACAVLELDTQEVADIRRRATAELDSQSRTEIG